jgi:hypothetical protein
MNMLVPARYPFTAHMSQRKSGSDWISRLGGRFHSSYAQLMCIGGKEKERKRKGKERKREGNGEM